MSLSSWLLIAKSRRALLLNVLVGIVLFGAGWQVGRVMSPYYAAQPIVFEDRDCNNCSSSGGAREELVELQKEGSGAAAVAKQQPAATPAATTPPASGGEQPSIVAGATTQGQFVGSVNSDKYHHTDCSTWKRIKEENQIWFITQADAEAAGYSPTVCTADKLGL